MTIQMIGIDHNKATIDERAIFSFTKGKSISAMEEICKIPNINGCIIISTCNRLEIWASVNDDFSDCLYKLLCNIKNVDHNEYKNAFVHRNDVDAINHLFYLASGLKSQILGEDQIITQVKDSLVTARESGFTDSTLEVLFRMAVTAGKRVKTEVVLTKGNLSSVDEAIINLKKSNYEIKGKNCMVIGNGQMGKLAANAFIEQKSNVFVTIRQYKHSKVLVPDSANIIHYDDRVDYMPNCDIIVSATSSPHLTLTPDMIRHIKTDIVLIDLAVPRDIDIRCKELPNVTMFDIDDFKISDDEIVTEAKNKASEIISEEIESFFEWQNGAIFTPRIQFIKEEASNDVNLRVKKRIRKINIDKNMVCELENHIDAATQNVINKMLFGLKNSLTKEEFAKCIEGLEKVYE